MAFMPWNYELIQSMYPSAGVGFLNRVGNRINVHPPVVATAIKDMIQKEGGDPDSPSIIARAREMTANESPSKKPFLSPTFGYIAQWLSEVVGAPTLDALLVHADTYLTPSWSNGGLYYARCDVGWDERGNYTYVEPYTGNAAIGYARLNVKDGQKKMWDKPWTREDVANRPWVDGIGLEGGIDCLRGRWDDQRGAMFVTLRTWNESHVIVTPIVNNLPPGRYGVYVDGEIKTEAVVNSHFPKITIDLEVGGRDVDLVVLRA